MGNLVFFAPLASFQNESVIAQSPPKRRIAKGAAGKQYIFDFLKVRRSED